MSSRHRCPVEEEPQTRRTEPERFGPPGAFMPQPGDGRTPPPAERPGPPAGARMTRRAAERAGTTEAYPRRDFGPPPFRDTPEAVDTAAAGEAPTAPTRPAAADTGPQQRPGPPAPAQRGEPRPPQWAPAGPAPTGRERWAEQRGGNPAAAAAPQSWSYVRPDPQQRAGAQPQDPARPRLAQAPCTRAPSGWSTSDSHPMNGARPNCDAKVRSLLRGRYKIGVLGKGGTGKTTIAACVGSIFAELRQEDRVVAIDADTAFGKLGSRIDPNVAGSYWELAADQYLDSFADMRTRVGNNTSGLFVLAGESSTARRRVLDPRSTGRPPRGWTTTSPSPSSTAVRRWIRR